MAMFVSPSSLNPVFIVAGAWGLLSFLRQGPGSSRLRHFARSGHGGFGPFPNISQHTTLRAFFVAGHEPFPKIFEYLQLGMFRLSGFGLD